MAAASLETIYMHHLWCTHSALSQPINLDITIRLSPSIVSLSPFLRMHHRLRVHSYLQSAPLVGQDAPIACAIDTRHYAKSSHSTDFNRWQDS